MSITFLTHKEQNQEKRAKLRWSGIFQLPHEACIRSIKAKPIMLFIQGLRKLSESIH